MMDMADCSAMLEQNRKVALTFIQAAGRGDQETVRSCLAGDAVNVAKGFGKFAGSRPFASVDYAALMTLLPTGINPVIHTVTAEADRVVVEFEGNARTSDGKPYCNEYCWVFTMQHGLIKQVNEYFCTILTDEVLWPLVERFSN